MIRHDFSQFSYAVNNDSAKKGKKEILVCFMYNGTEVLKKVYIPEKEGTAYIFEAKKIIDQEMRNGDLAAYAHKFAAKNKKKEGGSSKPKASSSSSSSNVGYALPPKKGLKIAFVIVCVLLVGAVALAIMFMLKKPDTPAPTPDKVAITFDGNGGSWTTAQTVEYSKTITVDKGTKWSSISKPETNPKLDGKTFKEWTINGTKVVDDYVFDASTTTVTASYDANQFNIEFQSGEHGKWGTVTKKVIPVTYGTTFAQVKQQVAIAEQDIDEDYKFIYFADGTENNSPLGDSYVFTGKEKPFVAQYVLKGSLEVTITVDANGGSWKDQTGSLFVYTDQKPIKWDEPLSGKFKNLLELPEGYDKQAVSWEYYVDKSWVSLPNDGSVSFVTNTQIRAILTPVEFKVTFNAGEGTFGEDPGTPSRQITVKHGDTYGEHAGKLTDINPPENKHFTYFTYTKDSKTEILTESYVFDARVSSTFTANYEFDDQVILVVDANGGMFDNLPIKSETIMETTTWAEINVQLAAATRITPPANMGFAEWQYYDGSDWATMPTTDEAPGETQHIRATYTITGNITITFDRGEGTWDDGDDEQTKEFDEVKFNDTFATFKTTYGNDIDVKAPERRTFVYYKVTTSTDTTKVGRILGDDYVLTDGEVYTAHYIQTTSDYVSVAIDPQGGKIGGDTGSTELLLLDQTAIGTTWSQIKTANPGIGQLVAPVGKTLNAWQYYDVEESDWFDLTDDYEFNANTRVKATYDSITLGTITFSAGDGKWADGTEGNKVKQNANYGVTFVDLDNELKLEVEEADERHVFTHFSIGDQTIGPDYSFTNSGPIEVVAQYASSEEVVDLHIDLGEGTIGGQNSFDLELVKGTTWGQLEDAYGNPTAPDGQRLVGFFYAGGEGELPISSTTIFDGIITSIYAKYEDIPTTTSNFATDDWATFTSVFNSGFDFASTTAEGENGGYKSAYDGHDGTFVGLTRTVTIGDVDYEVKVIDENKDLLTGGTATDTAALTFEFTNAITDAVPFSTLADNSKDYQNSNLEKYLNNDVYNMLPKDLRDNIKGVDKTIYDPSSAAAVPTKVVSNKLFSLSLSEMGVATLPSGTAVLNEGSTYQAYTGGTIDYVKRNKANVAVPYWVRTSDFEFPEVKGAWCFDATGAVGIVDPDDPIGSHVSYDILCGLAVVPAFCIGVGA